MKGLVYIIVFVLILASLLTPINIHLVKAGEPTVAMVFIKPRELRQQSIPSWVTALIFVEPYAFFDIDPSTVMLDSIFSPSWINISGGFIAAFDGNAVFDYILHKLYRLGIVPPFPNYGISVNLTITGRLLDGTPFEGSDTIFVYFLPTIYIKADGSVDPYDAPISTIDKITYTLTNDILGSAYGIVVERNNIIVDGAGHTICLSGEWGEIIYTAGIFLREVTNVTIQNVCVQGFHNGIWLKSALNNTISKNIITNNVVGIFLDSYSTGNMIAENIVTNNSLRGIDAVSSTNNFIVRNEITSNWYGVSLSLSSNNIINRNTLAINEGCGIYLFSSSSNVLSSNVFVNNSLFVFDSYDNFVIDNLVNDKPLVYLESVSDMTVSDAGQVILVSSDQIEVKGLILSNLNVGIELWKTNNTVISQNNITKSRDGVVLYYSFNNIISENNIVENLYGIYSQYTKDNSFYHNNFMNNAVEVYSDDSANVWDDGYPSGGNYWSDYTGLDANGDGIVDTPYIIDTNNRDRYPLMTPWPQIQDFSISASPKRTFVLQGSLPYGYRSGFSEIEIRSLGPFNQPVQLTVSSVPGINAYLYPQEVTPPQRGSSKSTLYVMASLTTEPGDYTLTITGSSGNLTHSVNFTVIVGPTIYIWSNGTVYPSTTPILKVGNVYTFTNNIFGYIVVLRDNIVLDGAGYTLQGLGPGTGIGLYGRTNVTIKNIEIKNFLLGVALENSSNNTIAENKIITAEKFEWWAPVAISIYRSSNNSIFENSIIEGVPNVNAGGIFVGESSNNTLFRNNIENVSIGIDITTSSHNTFFENNIIYSDYRSINIWDSLSNTFYHNNFINAKWKQVFLHDSVNVWDDGYPSGGNYWSDYTGFDEKSGPNQDHPGSDGIGDTPYVIDANNVDHYPLMKPWSHVESWSFDTDFQYNLDDNYGTAEGFGHTRGSVTLSGSDLLIQGEVSLNGQVPSHVPTVYLIATDGLDREYARQIVDLSQFAYSQTAPNTYTLQGKIQNAIKPINNGHYEVEAQITYNNQQYEFFINTNSKINSHYLPLTTLKPPPKFRIGDWVQTTDNLNVREGPGLSYSIISTMPLGTVGQILGGPVEADGYVWWNVNYTVGVRGWSAQNWLELAPPNQPPQPINLSPEDGATDVPLEPTFLSSPPLSDLTSEQIPWEEMDGRATKVYYHVQITTTPGDYSDPVYDFTDLWLIDKFFDFPPSPKSPYVRSGVLDYGTTYYWRIRYKDFRDVWSPWSNETSFTTILPIKEVIRRLIQQVRIAEKDTYVTIDEAQYIIAVLRQKIDPDTLSFEPDSGETVVYIDANGYAIPDGKVARKIGLIDTAQKTVKELDLSGKINELKSVKSAISGLNLRDLTWGGINLAATAGADIEKIINELTVLKRIGDSLTTIEKIKDLAKTQPLGLLQKTITYLMRKMIWDPYGEVKVTLEKALSDALTEYTRALNLLEQRQYKIEDFQTANEFLTSLYYGQVHEEVARHLLEKTFKNWGKLVLRILSFVNLLEKIPIVKHIPGLEFVALVKEAADALDWLNDADYVYIVKTYEAQANLGYKLSDDAKYSLKLAQASAQVQDYNQKYFDYIAEGYKQGEKLLQEAIPFSSFLRFLDSLRSLKLSALFSPGELRVYDSLNRVTGLIYGQSIEEIPDSLYDDEINIIIIFDAMDTYRYEVIGTDKGSYGLEISSIENGNITTFIATDIPILANATYQYNVDWDALSQGDEGVTVQVDSDGDGVFEHALTSDSELTQSEYIIATDDTPPETSILVGEPKFVIGDITYLTSITPISLIAEDNVGGSGVALTCYRIYNASYDSGWVNYTQPFYLIGLSDGVYYIDFNSTDNAGNVEPTNTITVILDNTPPETTITIGEPKYVSDAIYVTPETSFRLDASDGEGSGVHSTSYRIYNSTYDSGWLSYTDQFYCARALIGLADGVYTIEYYSVDNLGNVEATRSFQITLFSWNYIFEDSYGRGTVLKINLAYKFFQFIARDKDYGIREAAYMRQCGRTIIIHHCDSELRLITAAVDTKLDFCVAIAWDKQTHKQYFLIDKIGKE